MIGTNLEAGLALIQQQTKDGVNLGCFIAYYQEELCLQAYFELLAKLVEHLPQQVFSLLTSKLSASSDETLQRRIQSTGVDLGDLISLKQSSHEVIYDNLLSQAVLGTLNTSSVVIADYIQYIPKVKAYLLALPSTKGTLVLLNNCLNKKSGLGQFCATSTGIGGRTIARMAKLIRKDSRETTMVSEIKQKINKIILEPGIFLPVTSVTAATSSTNPLLNSTSNQQLQIGIELCSTHSKR